MLFTITAVVLGLTTVGNGALLYLLSRGPGSLLKRILTIYIIGITVWTAAIFFNLWLSSSRLEHVIFFSAAVFLTAQFWFAKLFPQGEMPKRWLDYWSISIGVAFAFVSCWPGAVFSSLMVHPDGYTILGNGFLSAQYSIFALVYVVTPVFILIHKWFKTTETKVKNQIKLLTSGFAAFALVNVLTNSILPVFFSIFYFNAIGPVSSLLLGAFIAYSIGQFQLFNIRAAVQRSVFYSLSFSLVLLAYAGIVGAIQYLFSIKTLIAVPFSASLVLIVSAYCLPILEKRFRHYTDRFFFKGHYDYSESLENVSSVLHENSELDQLTKQVSETLAQILRAEQVVVDTVSNGQGRIGKAECRLTDDGFRMSAPLLHGNKVVGQMMAYEKLSGDRYNKEDLQLLRTLSHHAGTALERALLLQQVQEYNKDLERMVEQRTEELASAQEGQRQIMLDIAHGLQTPLSILRTTIDNQTTRGEGKKINETLVRSIDDLSDFMHNLLKLALLENNNQPQTYERLSLSQLMTDIAEEVAVIAAGNDIEFTTDIAPNINILGDGKDLRAACMNIISNAIKYTRRSPERRLTINLKRSGQVATITITDSGIGISAIDLPRLFERFYRTAISRGVASGSGLGLPISKEIVEQHNGSIEIESTPGLGTTVTIRLIADK